MFCENSKCVLAGVSIKNRNLSNSPIQCVNEKTLAQSNIELESAIRQRLIDKALARKNHFTKLHPNDVSSSGKNSDVSNFDKNSNFRNPITTNDSASSKKPPWWHLSPSQPSALPPSNGIPFHELSNEHPAAILTASSAVPKGSTKRSGADLTGERWKLLKKFPDITSAPLTFRANATPVIPNKLEQMLSQHPNREFANYIVDIIRNGANLRTTNFIPDRIRIRKNLKSAIDHKTRIHSYLRAETAAGRIAGPFPSPDIHPCIQYWPFVTHSLTPVKNKKKDRIYLAKMLGKMGVDYIELVNPIASTKGVVLVIRWLFVKKIVKARFLVCLCVSLLGYISNEVMVYQHRLACTYYGESKFCLN